MRIRLILAVLIGAVLAGVGYGGWRLFHGPDVVMQATARLDAGDPRGAQALLRRALASAPRNAAGHALLARADLTLDQPLDAEKEARAALALHYDGATVSRLLGEAMLRQKRYHDVLEELPAIAAHPDQLVVNLVMRSAAYLGLDDAQQAADTIEQARRLAPDDPGVLLSQARLAVATHDMQRFRQTIARLLAQKPDDIEALLLDGQMLAQAGDPKAAVAAYDKAVAAAPASSRARLRRARLLMTLGHDDAAQTDVETALAADWRDPAARLLKAELLLKAGRLGEARSTVQALESYIDDEPRIAYVEAEVALQQQEPGIAEDFIRQYVAREPDAIDGLRLLGRIELQLGHPTLVLTYLAAAVAHGVQDAEVFDLLGRADVMIGKIADAVASFRHARDLAPGDEGIGAHLRAAQRLADPHPGEAEPIPTAHELTP